MILQDKPSKSVDMIHGHTTLRALIMGIGQNCQKTPPISPYQGKKAC